MIERFKIIFLTCLCIIATTFVFSQYEFQSSDKRSIIKLNVPALAFKNFSVQYEYALMPWQSLTLSVRYRPEGNVPFSNTIQKILTDRGSSLNMSLAKYGNFAITPEYRYYVGRKKPLGGFYMSLFLSYNRYSGDVPIKYSDYDETNHQSIDKFAVFKGKANTYTIGFQLGAQWNLSSRLVLDWWVIGPNYGVSDGDFFYNGPLNDYEQISMQFELQKIKTTIPLLVIDLPQKPNATEAMFRLNGPWAGLRAMGVCIGYRF